MKNKTMAVTALAVMVLVSALLLPAFDVASEPGHEEGNPKYIIGEKTEGIELGAGKTARISFNNTAFTGAATVKFQAKGPDTYQDVALNTSVMLTTTDIKIRIEGGDGVYSVTFTPGASPQAGTVIVKMTVTETKNGESLDQHFFYAANFSTEFSDPKIVVYKNNSPTEEYYSQIDGGTVTTLELAYDTPYSMKLETKVDNGAGGWKVASDFLFYGTGLPDGLAVTIDGRIGGKISSTAEAGKGGTMTIHAVMGGIDKTLEIPWKIGEKPATTGADFDIKYGEATVGTYVMIKAADTPTFTLEAVTGKGTITDAKFVVGTIEQTELSEWSYKVTFPGTGTYKVTATCTMELGGVSMKVEKSFTVYCVSAIYDGDLNPVVTAP